MTKEELKNALEDCINKNNGDTEDTHVGMDALLVSTLRELGYDEAMEVYEKQSKWYS